MFPHPTVRQMARRCRGSPDPAKADGWSDCAEHSPGNGYVACGRTVCAEYDGFTPGATLALDNFVLCRTLLTIQFGERLDKGGRSDKTGRRGRYTDNAWNQCEPRIQHSTQKQNIERVTYEMGFNDGTACGNLS